MASLRSYYWSTKPGIVYGNCLTATGGFLLAAQGFPDVWLFIPMLIGIALVMASACVFNNVIDRRIDALMTRTKKRALAAGTITKHAALVFGSILGIIGLTTLAIGTNALATGIALAGMVVYVVLYGYWKRRSVYGTVVGSFAGAVPPVVGYCAATNHFDLGAFLLFIILALWQMPHFYAIAMFRYNDYKAAGIPVLPVVKGMKLTKRHIIMYIAIFTAATSTLTFTGYTGFTFAAVMALIGLTWLGVGVAKYRSHDDAQWARTMFKTSLLVLLSLSIMLSVGALLP